MVEFLVEVYVSRADGDAVERSAVRARQAAEALTRQGTPVRYVRTIFVPEDETCFFLYEAGSAEAVREALTSASVVAARIGEAVEST